MATDSDRNRFYAYEIEELVEEEDGRDLVRIEENIDVALVNTEITGEKVKDYKGLKERDLGDCGPSLWKCWQD